MTVTKAVSDVLAEIDRIRQAIAAHEAQRPKIARTLLPRAEAEQRAKDAIRKAAAGWSLGAEMYASPGTAGPPRFAMALRETPVTFISALMGDRMVEMAMAELALFYRDNPATLTDAQRAEMLETIDAEIFKLCRTEERLARQAETLGIPVDRRASAPPILVLAPDNELEL